MTQATDSDWSRLGRRFYHARVGATAMYAPISLGAGKLAHWGLYKTEWIKPNGPWWFSIINLS